MELLVGDSVLSNSFSWEVASVALTFSSGSGSEVSDNDHQKMYKPKPEIKVQARPEVLKTSVVIIFISALVP
jgi:hypothetical protein